MVVTCVLTMLFLVACGAEQKAEEKPVLDDVLSTSAEGVSDPKAAFIASTYLGLPEQAPPTYWYADTSEKTAPSKSFGLYSSTNNQRILFVVFNDKTPVENLGFFTKKPPYVTCMAPTDDNTIKTGNTNLGKKNLNWVLVKCKKPKDQFKVPGIGQAVENQEDKSFPVLVGSMRTRKKGKCMLIIGRGYFDDYKYSNDETVLRLENAFKKRGEGEGSSTGDDDSKARRDADKPADDDGNASEDASKADDDGKASDDGRKAGDDGNPGDDRKASDDSKPRGNGKRDDDDAEKSSDSNKTREYSKTDDEW